MKFEDREAFETWLKGQSREVCVAIAARAALRVWPAVSARRYWDDDEEAQAERDKLTLLTGWCIVIAGVMAFCPAPEIKETAAYAAASASSAQRASARPSARAAARASARAAAASKARSPERNASRATASYDTVAKSATYADSALPLLKIFSTPLWYDKGWPNGLSPEDIGPTLLDTDPRFDFFRRWYDGMVRGEPLDWELQRRVALIPRETWEAGVDAVAEAIAEIEARFNVQRAAAQLIADRDSAVIQDRLGLGGNNPPEPIEVPPEVLSGQTIVWAAIAEIAEEAQAEAPDKTRVTKALAAVKQGLGVCLKWAARKADLAVDTVIKWGIPALGAGYLASNPAKVQALIHAVEKWLPFLP